MLKLKECIKCRELKTLDNFNKNVSKSDGLQSYCRDCNKARMKAYYAKNCVKMRKQICERNRQRLRKHKKMVDEIKRNTKCYFCKESEPACLDFHHVKKKYKEVSLILQSGAKFETLLKEIRKCVVLCANCHRKVHAKLLHLPNHTRVE